MTSLQLKKPEKQKIWGRPAAANFILGGTGAGFYLVCFFQAVMREGFAGADKALDALEDLIAGDGASLCGGPAVTLADLHLVPVLTYYTRAPAGAEALGRRPRLSGWWSRIADRPSVVKTMPRLG